MAFDRPGDHERFGRYADVGEKPAGSWRGVQAPAGYWVYVQPTWYLWDHETSVTPYAAAPASQGMRPTAVLEPMPLARAATLPAEESPEPPHAAPIPTRPWQESTLPNDAPDEESCPDPSRPSLGCSDDPGESASACGRYGSLLRVIFRPQARRQFPDYHREGWRKPGDWQGAKAVPGGFWVYVYPNWYVWETEVAVPAMRAD